MYINLLLFKFPKCFTPYQIIPNSKRIEDRIQRCFPRNDFTRRAPHLPLQTHKRGWSPHLFKKNCMLSLWKHHTSLSISDFTRTAPHLPLQSHNDPLIWSKRIACIRCESIAPLYPSLSPREMPYIFIYFLIFYKSCLFLFKLIPKKSFYLF